MKPKLHIGSGKNYLPDFENVDIFSTFDADSYSTALSLPYPMESFELIYASHVLEHINRNMILAALIHWKNLLLPGGTLRIAVPNFNAIVSRYNKTSDLSELLGLLYGGQHYLLDQHKIIFDKQTLTNSLLSVGFVHIRKWDWKNVEHSCFDDYSQAYLPHMDKVKGTLMSLNIEAIKP